MSSDTTEPLAAILAEMRKCANLTVRCGKCREQTDIFIIPSGMIDRIEEAAKRERAITDIMLAVKDKPLPHPDPEHAPPLLFPMTKTQLQTLSDLVAIAHDEMDGLPHHEQELERFDSLLFDMKARYAFDKPHAALGNAAALREALEKIARQDHGIGADISNIARAALSAPARNCDRPECADAESAWATYCAETNRADCREFARWLFAPAEGGDHA